MHNLKPTGFPPDNSRSLPINWISSTGVENAECVAGEMQSGKLLGVKSAIGITAAKITTADFPDQITTGLFVINTDRAFAGIVGKVTHFRALVQGQNGVCRQRPKTHRGNVVQRQ